MTKKVLLINGPSQDPSDRFFGWPTSLLYAIAPSVSESRAGRLDVEFANKIFDPVWYAGGQTELEFENVLRREKPDVVCGSAIYDSVYPTAQFFRIAKKVDPKISIIFGGPHFDEAHTSNRLNDVRVAPDLIDVAIAGDGELALLETLRALSSEKRLSSIDWSRVPGRATVYTRVGEVFHTSSNGLYISNLPSMPIEFADISRHKNDYDIFTDGAGHIIPTVQMIAARGCPYSCACCSEGRDLAYPNARNIANIVEEIELRKSQGFRAVFFDDSTFGAYPRLIELLMELGKTGMQFGSLNRFNHLVNPKVLERYQRAGFRYFYCAIEQFDDSALRSIGKAQEEKVIRSSIELLHKHGIALGVSLLYGLPGETSESIRRTIEFTAEAVGKGAIKLVSESALAYHPGTVLGKDLQDGFHRTPPNKGYPFDRFEEGQWYHPPNVTAEYLEGILRLSEQRFSGALVRNRHYWYAQRGMLGNTQVNS